MRADTVPRGRDRRPLALRTWGQNPGINSSRYFPLLSSGAACELQALPILLPEGMANGILAPLFQTGQRPCHLDVSCPCCQDIPEAWGLPSAFALSLEQRSSSGRRLSEPGCHSGGRAATNVPGVYVDLGGGPACTPHSPEHKLAPSTQTWVLWLLCLLVPGSSSVFFFF